jgi:hypothetical protein
MKKRELGHVLETLRIFLCHLIVKAGFFIDEVDLVICQNFRLLSLLPESPDGIKDVIL